MSDPPNNTPANLPTLRDVVESWLGFRLPDLPALPQTVKNLDKVCAALLDVPIAQLEGKATVIRNTSTRSETLEATIVEAMRRQLKNPTSEKVAVAVDCMVTDYLEKRLRRERVAEIAAEEIAQSPPSNDASQPIDDDWMAFFKGKVDQLGTDEAKFMFGKVLAGEVQQPGSFSKRALGILAEMGQDVGRLFDRLCNVSTVTLVVPVVPLMDVRVITDGFGNAGSNSLQKFGLPFNALNRLNEAGLIIADYNSYATMGPAALGRPIEVGGVMYQLAVLDAKKAELDTNEKRFKALERVNGVAFSAAGRELRAIVAKTPMPAYVEKLSKVFAEKGFELRRV